MRALALLALLLLMLPGLPMAPAAVEPSPLPLNEMPVPASHGAIAPYMHIAALDVPPGIRPGAWIQTGAANCTAAFVVQDPAGALYITTAGHCVGYVGQRVAVKQDAWVAALGTIEEFGTVVAMWPRYLDAALVRIDPDKYHQVSPRMIGWGGPTGIVTSIPTDPIVVRHYGWGWYTWAEHNTRCRSGVSDPDGPLPLGRWGASTWWFGGAVGNGDSGSAVMTEDGKALGILDWGGGLIIPPFGGPFIATRGGGVRLDAVLEAFQSTGGWQLSLVEGGPVNPACMPEPPTLPVG